VSFRVDKRPIRVDTLTVAFEIVKTRETTLASRVRTLVRLGPHGIVSLSMGLGVSENKYVRC